MSLNPAQRARILTALMLCLALVSCSSPVGKSTTDSKQASYAADNYVTPQKIYPYDLKSAQKQLTGKIVWVRPGSPRAYYRYGASGAGLGQKAGVLPTLGRLDIQDVRVEKLLVPISGVKIVRHQLVAVFTAPWQAGEYAVSVATESADSYNFSVNEEFFFEDPHQLYAHWPADVWAAIDRHEVKEGMSELQVSFALGPEVGSSGGDYGFRWVTYSDQGGTTKVVFKKNQAVEITRNGQTKG